MTHDSKYTVRPKNYVYALLKNVIVVFRSMAAAHHEKNNIYVLLMLWKTMFQIASEMVSTQHTSFLAIFKNWKET